MSSPEHIRCTSCKKSHPECGFPPNGLTCNDCNAKRKKRRAADSQRKAEAKVEKRRGKKKCAHGTWCDTNDFKPGQPVCEPHREYNRNRATKRRVCDQALALPSVFDKTEHLWNNNGSISSSDSAYIEGISAEWPPLNTTLATFTSFNSTAQSAGEGLPDLPDINEADISLLDGQLVIHQETLHGDENSDNPVVDVGVDLADQFGQMSLADQLTGLVTEGSSETTCDNCGTSGSGMPRCKRCKSVWYCDQLCQRESWKLHKKLCAAPTKLQSDTTSTATSGKDRIPKQGNQGVPTMHQAVGEIKTVKQCANCRCKLTSPQRCSKCRNVCYCSKQCQRQHHKHHQPECDFACEGTKAYEQVIGKVCNGEKLTESEERLIHQWECVRTVGSLSEISDQIMQHPHQFPLLPKTSRQLKLEADESAHEYWARISGGFRSQIVPTGLRFILSISLSPELHEGFMITPWVDSASGHILPMRPSEDGSFHLLDDIQPDDQRYYLAESTKMREWLDLQAEESPSAIPLRFDAPMSWDRGWLLKAVRPVAPLHPDDRLWWTPPVSRARLDLLEKRYFTKVIVGGGSLMRGFYSMFGSELSHVLPLDSMKGGIPNLCSRCEELGGIISEIDHALRAQDNKACARTQKILLDCLCERATTYLELSKLYGDDLTKKQDALHKANADCEAGLHHPKLNWLSAQLETRSKDFQTQARAETFKQLPLPELRNRVREELRQMGNLVPESPQYFDIDPIATQERVFKNLIFKIPAAEDDGYSIDLELLAHPDWNTIQWTEVPSAVAMVKFYKGHFDTTLESDRASQQGDCTHTYDLRAQPLGKEEAFRQAERGIPGLSHVRVEGGCIRIAISLVEYQQIRSELRDIQLRNVKARVKARRRQNVKRKPNGRARARRKRREAKVMDAQGAPMEGQDLIDVNGHQNSCYSFPALNDECPVCTDRRPGCELLDPLDDAYMVQPIVVCPNNHCLCQKCLDDWVKQQHANKIKPFCPICMVPIDSALTTGSAGRGLSVYSTK